MGRKSHQLDIHAAGLPGQELSEEVHQLSVAGLGRKLDVRVAGLSEEVHQLSVAGLGRKLDVRVAGLSEEVHQLSVASLPGEEAGCSWSGEKVPSAGCTLASSQAFLSLL